MLIAARVHPFPSRTRKLSSPAPKILDWRRSGKIGFRQHKKTTCANRWFFCACGGQVAGRSLSLALPGVKRQLSVRGGSGGCATGMSRGARCRSLYSEKNASCLSAMAAVAAPRASRGVSLPLALLGEKRQLSVRGGCGGCATGMSRGARCHSLHPEKNTGCLSARAG